jgi:alpha-L-fucosidase
MKQPELSRRELLGATAATTLVSLPRVASAATADGPIQPTWESIASHYTHPEWFRDAKLGIWAHWGPQCQPEFGDWYARALYQQGRKPWDPPGETAYENHLRRYGHPSRTGFLDIIGQWKAQNWQPDYLVRKYAAAGARYFVGMGCHHDNFDLYSSRHHNWNSTRVGPKKDILAGWSKAAREAGLRFGVSNHSGHAWHWYQPAYGYDAEGPMRGRRYDAYWLRKHHGQGKFWEGLDPQELYTGPYYVAPPGITSIKEMNDWHGKRDGQWLEGIPVGNIAFVETWLQRQKQIVEDYKPDLMFMDHAGVPFGHYGLEAVAHYYNQAIAWHGSPDVIMTGGLLDPFAQRALTWNVERGALNDIHSPPWQTCTCIGNWHYDRRLYDNNGYKSAKQVTQILADVVSKNGTLLFNVPVRGDGTIDEKEEAIVDQFTGWTRRNGEAIFATRPWHTFGEGPTKPPPAGAFGESQQKPFTGEDLRFTRKGETLYAIFLDWPQAESAIRSLGGQKLPDAVVERVDLIGGSELQFRRDADALRLTVPPPQDGDFIPALRINGRGLV